MSTPEPPSELSTPVRTPAVDEPPLRRLVGRRPAIGAAPAAKTVIDDVRSLVKAEVALAKAEVTEGVKSKVLGAGFFIVVAVIGWLAIQVFLVFLGFLFALFLPGWAAVGMVLLLLVIVMAILGYLGYRKLQAEANLTTTKQTVAESQTAAKVAVSKAQEHAKEGAEEAKAEVKVATDDVKTRIQRKVAEIRGTQPPPPLAPVRPQLTDPVADFAKATADLPLITAAAPEVTADVDETSVPPEIAPPVMPKPPSDTPESRP